MLSFYLCSGLWIIQGCQPSNTFDFPETVFEKSGGTQSAAYEEGIRWWSKMAEHPSVNMAEFGQTDAGYPLHVVMVTSAGKDVDQLPLLLINNAIHPGEPDGVDASMLLVKNLLQNPSRPLDRVVLAIIPYYNIGGSKLRGKYSRANQNGPLEYGFRGNAGHYDLNRDYLKLDSRNAATFARLLRKLDPDLYIETHVSNGADYRHNLTLLPTLSQKLDTPLGDYFRNKWEKPMYKIMAQKQEPMVPYVNVFETAPDSGYEAFLDGPRYSTGYAALFQIPGFITETLMLQPYANRVKATLTFLESTVEKLAVEGQSLKDMKQKARRQIQHTDYIPIDWRIEKDRWEWVNFKGYEAVWKYSEIMGDSLITFDRNSPKDMKIRYFNEAIPTVKHGMPEYFILENGYHEVKRRLKIHGVAYRELLRDTVLQVVGMRIEGFETSEQPYEGHYPHFQTTWSPVEMNIQVPRGSWMISSKQRCRRLLAEVFFPDGPDSYFNWNFFDTRLQQKEWYSTYVFEPKARELLKDESLKQKFEDKLKSDSAFAANPGERLLFVYRNSPYYEWQHRVLPVYLSGFR